MKNKVGNLLKTAPFFALSVILCSSLSYAQQGLSLGSPFSSEEIAEINKMRKSVSLDSLLSPEIAEINKIKQTVQKLSKQYKENKQKCKALIKSEKKNCHKESISLHKKLRLFVRYLHEEKKYLKMKKQLVSSPKTSEEQIYLHDLRWQLRRTKRECLEVRNLPASLKFCKDKLASISHQIKNLESRCPSCLKHF